MYLFRFYHTHFHDFHIDPMKLISWLKQSIPEIFEYMEEDAYDFGACCFEYNPTSVLTVD